MNNNNGVLVSEFEKSGDKLLFFSQKNISQKAILLEILTEKNKKFILKHLAESEILEILQFMDPDDVADIIPLLSKHYQKRILGKLNVNLKEKVDFLLKFAPKSAAGLMNLNYIIVPLNTQKEEILNKIEKHISKGKKEPSILIVNDAGNFIGEIRISNLIFESDENLYLAIKKIPTVIYNKDQEECIDIFKKNKHEKIVVLDENEFVLGLIHAKDIFRVIEEENTQDFYAIAGLKKEEDISDNAFLKVKFRLGWLIVNLGTAFLAAFVVSTFEETISKLVLLAAFMPIIAGMGGNAGTQTTAIIIRSLALKKIDPTIGKKILMQEFFAGAINGVILGIIVGIIAIIFNQSLLFALVGFMAITINMVVAGLFGTIVPLTLKAFGFDPASSSSVFVTTATDVFGFLALLGLATLILL